jgi:hypothetical protein
MMYPWGTIIDDLREIEVRRVMIKGFINWMGDVTDEIIKGGGGQISFWVEMINFMVLASNKLVTNSEEFLVVIIN